MTSGFEMFQSSTLLPLSQNIVSLAQLSESVLITHGRCAITVAICLYYAEYAYNITKLVIFLKARVNNRAVVKFSFSTFSRPYPFAILFHSPERFESNFRLLPICDICT